MPFFKYQNTLEVVAASLLTANSCKMWSVHNLPVTVNSKDSEDWRKKGSENIHKSFSKHLSCMTYFLLCLCIYLKYLQWTFWMRSYNFNSRVFFILFSCARKCWLTCLLLCQILGDASLFAVYIYLAKSSLWLHFYLVSCLYFYFARLCSDFGTLSLINIIHYKWENSALFEGKCFTNL